MILYFHHINLRGFSGNKKKEKLVPINYNLKNRVMRQNHRKTIVENGAIYIFNSENLKV